MFFSLAIARAATWERAEDPAVESLSGWTNEVEIGDLDGDGDLDVILANGGSYSSAGSPEPSYWLDNDGAGAFTAREVAVGLYRSAKIRDLDADGLPDLLLPGAWGTQSRLLVGGSALADASANLPPGAFSFHDAEPGDVDGDGDLDVVLTDSGPQNALFGDGAPVRLWLNDGAGLFTDSTDSSMPATLVPWSWDIELMDIDLDLDLDLLVSCKTCDNSMIFTNDGAGRFTDRSSLALPDARSNNYDFESLDLTGDGYPDLATINDGPGLRERILVNDGSSAFLDETSSRLPESENLGEDDNVLVMLDADSDADIDILIGSLSGDDRLLYNDGTGVFSVDTAALSGPPTQGTLALAAGDLDADGRLDLVMGQGEAASVDYWYRGVDIPVDTLPPDVQPPSGLPLDSASLPARLVAQIHDHKTPITPDDLTAEIEWTVGSESGTVALTHAGGALWQGSLDDIPAGEGTAVTCATDRLGNSACSDPVAFGSPPAQTGETGTEPPTDGTLPPGDTAEDSLPEGTDGEEKGCGCATASPPAAAMLVWLASAVTLARRPRAR